MAKWYYSAGDRAQGPVDEAVILETIRNGQLTLVDLVYREGDKAWHTVGEIPEFSAAVVQPQAVVVEEALPPAISSNGPFRFEGGVTLTWVLLQKKTEGDRDRYDQSGPFSAEELEAQLTAGTAKYSDYVWRPGYRRWTRLGNLPEFDRRRKTRDGDKTPDLVPLPDIEEVDFPRESRELLSAVVQAAPPPLASLSVPERPPAEAAGRTRRRRPPGS